MVPVLIPGKGEGGKHFRAITEGEKKKKKRREREQEQGKNCDGPAGNANR